MTGSSAESSELGLGWSHRGVLREPSCQWSETVARKKRATAASLIEKLDGAQPSRRGARGWSKTRQSSLPSTLEMLCRIETACSLASLTSSSSGAVARHAWASLTGSSAARAAAGRVGPTGRESAALAVTASSKSKKAHVRQTHALRASRAKASAGALERAVSIQQSICRGEPRDARGRESRGRGPIEPFVDPMSRPVEAEARGARSTRQTSLAHRLA